MRELMHTIIAGAPKSATTSLFRYLSSHPNVKPSTIKETNFLSKKMIITEETFNNYNSYFKNRQDHHRILLEASPGYLLNANIFCSNFKKIIKQGKIIVILRDPKDLLYSFFKHRKNKTNELRIDTTYDNFIETIMSEDINSSIFFQKTTAKEIIVQKKIGRYVTYLKILYENIGHNNIKILFFDDIKESPLLTMKSVCKFLNIDNVHYNNFSFSIENKNRNYRSIWFHRIIHKIIMHSEPILNKYPAIREWLREVYVFFNEKKRIPQNTNLIRKETEKIIERYYTESSILLKEWLKKEYPEIILPKWLEHIKNEK
jgi:hypothetical protein